MKFRAAIAVLSLLVMSPALAGELHIFEHNRSVVSWHLAGDMVVAKYETPRAGLADVGVQEGTTLFEGNDEGGKFVGNAFTFKQGCPPSPYKVIGTWEGDWITLKGPAPIWSKKGCEIVGYTLNSPHATLRFRYSSTHH
jgi:hypothetical protein